LFRQEILLRLILFAALLGPAATAVAETFVGMGTIEGVTAGAPAGATKGSSVTAEFTVTGSTFTHFSVHFTTSELAATGGNVTGNCAGRFVNVVGNGQGYTFRIDSDGCDNTGPHPCVDQLRRSLVEGECGFLTLTVSSAGQERVYAVMDPFTEGKPPPVEVCNNNIDDDGDGLTDGQDPDCGTTPARPIFNNTLDTILNWQLHNLSAPVSTGSIVQDMSSHNNSGRVLGNEPTALVNRQGDPNFSPSNQQLYKTSASATARVASDDHAPFNMGSQQDFTLEAYIYRAEATGSEGWGMPLGTWKSRTLVNDAQNPETMGVWSGWGYLRDDQGGWLWVMSPNNADNSPRTGFNELRNGNGQGWNLLPGWNYIVASVQRTGGTPNYTVYCNGAQVESRSLADAVGLPIGTPTGHEATEPNRFCLFAGEDDLTQNRTRPGPSGLGVGGIRLQRRALTSGEVRANWEDIQAGRTTPAVEICDNNIDDDGDGLTDCEDADCLLSCPESSCDDGVDNDGDGVLDCADPDCALSCPESVCDDGVDNDEDGAADCADLDCALSCPEASCSDGIDEDQDGSTDCDDSDCVPFCPVTTCEGGVCVTVQGECEVTIDNNDGVDCPGLGNIAADLRLSLVARRDAVCIDINVCPAFMPPAMVCIDYSESELNAQQRERLKVLKCQDQGTCEILEPSVNDGQQVCVEIKSFSRFALVLLDDGVPFERGDCDNDGFVGGSVNDPVFYLNWAFGTGRDPDCKAACDADGDGFVGGSVNDPVYYLNWAFLGGQAPPAPFPGCGPGTPDDEKLGCETASKDCQ
jgi:hypothetical protein